jgi:hypothetical protein
MKATLFFVAMFIAIATSTSSRAAETPSPDIFQATYTLTIPAGDGGIGDVPIFSTPTDKRLVIQSVSVFRGGVPSPGSNLNVLLVTNIFNQEARWPLPQVYANGNLDPGTSMSATIYAGAGTAVSIDAFRTGDVTKSETFLVSVSGYYVAKP